MLFARLARDMPTLLAALVIAVSIQALLIFVSFVDLEARRWIVEHIAISTNVLTEDLYRAPGVTGSGGSALSVVQCLGVLSGGLLLRLRGRRQSLPTAVAVLLAMLLCLLSAALVGRTGFLLAILFLLWFAASSGQLSRLILIALALGVPAALSIPQLVEDLLPSSFSTDVFTTYVLGFLLTGTDASVSDLASMPIPPLGFDTLLGTGRVSPGPDGGNPSGHDSGFVQAYFGMGLVYATAFYACYAYVLLRLLRWLPLATRLMLAAALFAIEIKEPYVFKYACLFVLVACYTAAPLPRKAK
jgi:hypothetical protein